jgi:hypothetical protein
MGEVRAGKRCTRCGQVIREKQIASESLDEAYDAGDVILVCGCDTIDGPQVDD